MAAGPAGHRRSRSRLSTPRLLTPLPLWARIRPFSTRSLYRHPFHVQWEGPMRIIGTVRMLGILAAFAFAGQVGLAVAAEETKKEKAKEAPAAADPGGGIQSNKAKASESPRLTRGRSCSG